MPPIRRDTITYSLVSGVGDGNNSLFTLDSNGTLKTASILDYEIVSTLTIRVQAKDEFNASIEASFQVSVGDDQTEDTDGDGYSDGAEFAFGSDPWDRNSLANHAPAVIGFDQMGQVSTQVSQTLGNQTLPGMILWLDANNSATLSKHPGASVYRGREVTRSGNLVAYWDFEEDDDGLADVSGNGNRANFVGDPQFVSGKFGTALDFDHEGDYAYIDGFSGLTTADFLSVSAWVKLDSIDTNESDDSMIFATNANDLHALFFWYNADGAGTKPFLFLQCGHFLHDYQSGRSGASSAVANLWQHVVGTYHMGTKKIYLDGELKGTVTNSSAQVSPVHQRFFIGAAEGLSTNFRMNGMIDDLRVYNLELSQAEVTAIFGNGHGDLGSPVTAPSLQVTPPADGEPVLFWGDLSKEENHARITNVRTTGREPNFKSNAQNGLPSVVFADDYLAVSGEDSKLFDNLSEYSILVVAKGNSNREDWRPLLSKRGDGGQGWQFRTRVEIP